MEPIKVLIVDDSPLIRQVLSAIIDQHSDFRLCGAAADPYEARELINQYQPQVIILDIEMPKMDGLSFLEKIVRHRPTPVIMFSSLTSEGSEAALKALEIGAVDVLEKPRIAGVQALADYEDLLCQKIRQASTARVKAQLRPTTLSTATKLNSGSLATKLVLIGSSTGGTQALAQLLPELPADFPAVMVTQHLPTRFIPSFAERLNKISTMLVKVAEQGEAVRNGVVYIAPGEHHLHLLRQAGHYSVHLSEAAAYSGHRPSVDQMMLSAASNAKGPIAAALLTGMGRDGAEGMAALKAEGAFTIAQDEASCVVFGMPAAAIKADGASVVLPLNRIAAELKTRLS